MSADRAEFRDAAAPRHWLDAERIRVYSWMILGIFAAVLVGWIAVSLPDLVDPRGKPIGNDFIGFWSAARLALAGRPDAVFDWTALSAVQHAAVPSRPDVFFPWNYPPTFLLAMLPFGLLPYPAALALFLLGTTALWAALARRILPDRRAWIVAAAAPATLITVMIGQNGFLTAGLAGFALLWLERRPLVAGVLIGLLAIKPHLAVLFPLALLAEARWRTILAAGLSLALFAAASLAAFGWQNFAGFLDNLPLAQTLVATGAVPWALMASPYAFAAALGLPLTVATALQAAAALFAAGSVWAVWRNRAAAFELKAATLVTASLLVSPYILYYDLTWAALAVGWLAMLGLRTGFHRGEREILLLVWLLPVALPPIELLTSVQIGFPALLALLLLALRRAMPSGGGCFLRAATTVLREAPWITRPRLMRWGIGFVVLSLVTLGWDAATHTTHGVTNGEGEHLARDFVNYWAGARLAAAGQAGLAYDFPAFNEFEKSLVGQLSEVKLYSYPPTAMLLSLPLAPFGFGAALVGWVLLGVGLCFALLTRLIGPRLAAVVVLGAPACMLNLLTGQNGFFTAAMFAGGIGLLERRPAFAGLCFGLLSYKPQLAVLLPLALAAGSKWRVLALTAASAAGLALASVALLGVAPWTGFIEHLPVQRKVLEFGTTLWHRMPTVFAAARMIGAALPLAYAAQIVSGFFAAGAAMVVWRSSAPLAVKAAVLAVATFLATPYAWDYDAVVLVFAASWLGCEALRTGFFPWERLAVIALLTVPLPAMAIAKLTGLQLGPVVLWLVLLVLLRRAMTTPVPEPSYAAAAPS